MKKFLLVVLAVLMILPLAVSCAKEEKQEEVKTTPQEMQNLVILDYSKAYNEDGTIDETKVEKINEGPFTIAVPEGQKPTIKDVVDNYDPDREVHETLLPDFADIKGNEEFAWAVYVNGDEASMTTEFELTDEVKFVFEKLPELEQTATAEAAK